MPRCEYLDLSHNKLEDIQNLNYLSSLGHLDLSSNSIRMLNSLHTKLGNIKSLNLQGNKLESLLGEYPPSPKSLSFPLPPSFPSPPSVPLPPSLNSLHTKLGNIKSLNLQGNKLESLLGESTLNSCLLGESIFHLPNVLSFPSPSPRSLSSEVPPFMSSPLLSLPQFTPY